MQYMGSKNRIAKEILPIMLAERKPDQWWAEPFVGGANMIDKVDGKRIGADNNKYLIEALILIRDNPELIPKNNKEYTEEMYNNAKMGKIANCIDCFAMFVYSFGYKFKGGWARAKDGKDYVGIGYRVALKQSPKLKGVKLVESSYQDLEIPPNSLIYCDPPYKGVTKYKDAFNHEDFWQWCRDKTKEGHTVFISEYSAPDDFRCIWQKEINVNFDSNRVSADKRNERLYQYCG